MCTATELSFEQIKNILDNQTKRDFLTNPEDINPYIDSNENDEETLMLQMGGTLITQPNEHMLKQMDTALMKGFGPYGESLRSFNMLNLYQHNLFELLPRLRVSRMVRTLTKDGKITARAFLSNRYERIDDLDTIQCLLKAVEEHKETEYEHIGGCVTSLHTYLKMISKDKVVTIQDNQGNNKDFRIGFVFSNSEVGLGCCRLNMFVHDMTTGNNFILATEVGKVRYVHHGKQLAMFEGDSITELPKPQVELGKLSTVQEDLKEALNLITEPGYLNGFFDTLKASYGLQMDLKHPDDLNRYMDIVGKHLGISKPEQLAVVGRLLETGDTTLYGIFEAVSNMAKYAKTYERRIELETISGNAVTQLPKHWKAITQMAQTK